MKISSNTPPILIVSHPRSGTHLTIDLIRRQFPSTQSWRIPGFPNDHVYLNIERLVGDYRKFSQRKARRILRRPKRPILKTHFTFDYAESWTPRESAAIPGDWIDLMNGSIIIYIVRHPLDVMASYHQFMCGIDQSLSQESYWDFVFGPHWSGKGNRLEWWCRHVTEWSRRAGVNCVRYEDLVINPELQLKEVSRLLGEQSICKQPLLPPKITSVFESRVQRFFRWSPDSTAIVALKEKYPLYDWRSNATAENLSAVEEVVGGICRVFGYEDVQRFV